MELAREGLSAVLDRLATESRANEVPPDIVSYAAAATRVAFRGDDSEVADVRVRAYFRAVLRRRLARSRLRTPASARLIADSVVRDLLSSGRDREDVLDELERGWAKALGQPVIDEYRKRLCA